MKINQFKLAALATALAFSTAAFADITVYSGQQKLSPMLLPKKPGLK